MPPIGSDPAQLATSRDKLSAYVSPRHDQPFQLSAALDVIDHYWVTTSDRVGKVELLVHCLESGNLASEAYGDLFSEFYETMAEVAWQCADELADDAALLETVRPRVEAILESASHMGCRHAEALDQALGPVVWDDLDDE